MARRRRSILLWSEGALDKSEVAVILLEKDVAQALKDRIADWFEIQVR
jgi:hypothetical protein